MEAVEGSIQHKLDSFRSIAEISRIVQVLRKPFYADVTITDPPFSKHVQDNLCSGSLVGKKTVPRHELSFDPVTEFGWVKDLVAMTKRWALIYCALEDFGKIETVVGRPTYVRSCVVYKPNAMGQLTADRPATSYEGIALLHNPRTKKRWNGKGSYGIWKSNSTRGKKDRHPNEKPVPLMQKLVALFSERGETILDPFCGSAAIGEAAISLGRGYIGWDKDQIWVERSLKRIASPITPVTDEYALSLCRMKDG